VLTEPESGESPGGRVLRLLAPMLGLAITRIKLNRAGALIIDFGVPLPNLDYVRGEWRLAVFNSVWRLQSSSAVLLASGDDRVRIDTALQGLRGVELASMEVDERLLGASYQFGDKILRVFPVYTGPDDRYDAWTVWNPLRKQIRVGPGARVRIGEEADVQ
jgi:hypothetical protein